LSGVPLKDARARTLTYNLLRIRPFKRSKYSRGHFILLIIEKMTETERFFLPFIDKIERLNMLKN